MAGAASQEALSKALAVLGGENTSSNNNISLKSKIEFLLEDKGLSATEILEAIKLASTTGVLKLAGNNTRMKHDWIWTTAVPWVSVLAVGLLTSYFTGDCGDENDDDINNDSSLAYPSPDLIPISQEISSSVDGVLASSSIKADQTEEEEPIWATKVKILIYMYMYIILFQCHGIHRYLIYHIISFM